MERPSTQGLLDSEALYVARGIGIVLVVAGHISVGTGELGRIYAFHMPLFFFLSGMTLPVERAIVPTALRFTWKIATHYLIAAVILAAISAAIFMPLGTQIDTTSPFDWRTYLLFPFTRNSNHIDLYAVGWFLIALMPARAMAHGILRMPVWAVVLAALLLAYIGMDVSASRYAVDKQWYWLLASQIAVASGFISLGSIVQRRVAVASPPRPVLILLVAYVGFIVAGASGLNMAWGRYPAGFFLHALIASLGIVATLTVAEMVKKVALLRFVGRHSLAIMSFHLLVLATFNLPFVALGLLDPKDLKSQFALWDGQSWPIFLAAGCLVPPFAALALQWSRRKLSSLKSTAK